MPGGISHKFLLSLSLCTALTFFAARGYADTTYIIKKGDNPTTIAKKFNVTVQDILSANNLTPRKLMPGTEITIPSDEMRHGDIESPAPKSDITHACDSTCTEDIPDDTIIHRVKKGDTLSSLSRKYSVPVHAIQEMNNLTSTKIIAGHTLTVTQTQQKTYTVRKGDSLWKIARRFHRHVDELSEINELETDMLKPGQILMLSAREEPGHLNSPGAGDLQKKIEDKIEAVSESPEYTLKEKLIIFAKTFLDIPYKFGGSSFLGIDCSAFVKEVFGLIGIDLPRSAREQFSLGDSVEREKLSAGDLVFFRTYASFPSHVGIYLGNNEFIHTSSKLRKVTIDNLATPYYLKRFIGAKRLIEDAGTEGEQQDNS